MTDFEDDDVMPRSTGGSVHLVRAGVVIVCFLVGLILLLGPASNGVLTSPTATAHPKHPLQHVNRSATRVQVANGSSTQGAAGTTSHQLQVLGWDVLPAETTAVHPSHWIVYFKPGFQQAAKDVAGNIGVPHQHVVVRPAHLGVAGANQADVIVVIGASLKG